MTGRPDGARSRILDAAELLFAADGFDATPTARIAERAGVAKGLLFYHFPGKQDVLLALLAERMPDPPVDDLAGIARRGDVTGSLVRLARRLDLGGHESLVLRSIVFRELQTHPEVAAHARRLRTSLLALTATVLDDAVDAPLTAARRRDAAQVYVAVMLDAANAERLDVPGPDLRRTAALVAAGLAAG